MEDCSRIRVPDGYINPIVDTIYNDLSVKGI